MDLITHVGEPIIKKEGESVLELQVRVRDSMKTIIEKNRGEDSVTEALMERFLSSKEKLKTDENQNIYGFLNRNIE